MVISVYHRRFLIGAAPTIDIEPKNITKQEGEPAFLEQVLQF
jgi:hypothetical protein